MIISIMIVFVLPNGSRGFSFVLPNGTVRFNERLRPVVRFNEQFVNLAGHFDIQLIALPPGFYVSGFGDFFHPFRYPAFGFNPEEWHLFQKIGKINPGIPVFAVFFHLFTS